jgi:uncharacterized protein YigE (DUF2233 family)
VVGVVLAVMVLLGAAIGGPVQAQPRGRRGGLEAIRLIPRVVHRTGLHGRQFRLLRWRVRLDRMALDLTEMAPRETISDALRRTRATLILNGGFFDTRGDSMGLAVAGGQLQREPSAEIGGGMLVVRDGRASIHFSQGFVLPPGTDFAVQAKPVLVMGSQIAPLRSGVQPADRTAVCVRDEGRILDFYVARSAHPRARGGPTLRSLARTLQEAGCESALNLDGGRSTGAAWREGRRTVVLAARTVIHQLIVARPR